MTTSPQSSTQPRTVYYPKYRPLFLCLGVFMLLMIPVVIVRTHALPLALLLLFQALVQFALGTLIRIELSPSGIVYHNMGVYVISSFWEQVERTRDLDGRGIVLHESVVRGWTGLARMLERGEQGWVIPIGGRWQREAVLAQEIQRYLGRND